MKKRRRDLIPAIFAKRDLDDVGKRVAIQDRADGIPNVEHQDSQPAMRFIGTGAACVGCSTDAADRRQWTFDQADYLAKLDSVHGTCSPVAARILAM